MKLNRIFAVKYAPAYDALKTLAMRSVVKGTRSGQVKGLEGARGTGKLPGRAQRCKCRPAPPALQNPNGERSFPDAVYKS